MWGRFSSRRAAFYGSVQALRSAFGGAATTGIALVVVFCFAAIGWFSDALMTMIFPEDQPLWALLPLLILVLVIGRGFSAMPSVVPAIVQGSVGKAKILIWFLSPPGASPDETDPKKMRSWRMAYEAIHTLAQLGALERVIVIASSDSSGEKQDGTWRYFDAFRRAISASTGVEESKIVISPQHPKGVDFEDAKHLFDALDQIYEDLIAEGYKEEDILLDITGGQKMPAVVGGVVGLGEGRRIQYVSTRDYKIHEYDITYKVDT